MIVRLRVAGSPAAATQRDTRARRTDRARRDAPVLTTLLSARITSRGGADFDDKVPSAIRRGFAAHPEING